MERGEVWHVDLNPTKGREQAGARFVLIVSPKEFNRLGTPLCVPITQGGNFARNSGFAVHLTGIGVQTNGVILCHQLRTIDLHGRGAKRIEKLPEFIIDDVLARVSTLLE